jgi:hypothetical protein
MSAERLPAAAAREQAASLVAQLAAAAPELLNLDGIDLSGALEQQLFFALRDGGVPVAGAVGRLRQASVEVGRLAGATLASLLWWRAPTTGPRPLVALVAAPVHVSALLLIEAELQATASEAVSIVRVGRAASGTVPHATAPRLAELLHPRGVPPLIRHALAVRAGLGRATAAWATTVPAPRAAQLRRLARDDLGRIALGATALASAIRRWRPSLLVAFDEVGTWARLLPAAGRRFGVPTLDLPHAEAADAEAIRGAGYDRMAVYGPRAALVLTAAGIPRHRVVEIGAPRFDPLLAAVPDPAAGAPPGQSVRRVVFAAQYVQGAMTRDLVERSYLGALAAAETLAPAELVVVPHPVEQAGLAAAIAAEHPRPAGVAVRIARAGDLHAELPGATLLVTGWSNSVFEAALLRIPAITVSPPGVAPVDFAAEGLSLAAADPAEAAAQALRLVAPDTRDAVTEGARDALRDRIGVLDGRASERAARIMLEMAGRTDGDEAH